MLKTLLVSDLVDSTALVEQLGDARAAEEFRLLDRLARDLLGDHKGLEIDKTDGFLLLFERPLDAVSYALAYHEALARHGAERGLALSARVGIHLGEVYLTRNTPEDVARGAKPIEVEGLAKPFTARLMSAARGGQTLLTRGAFDLARRAAVGELAEPDLEWVAHGQYELKGVDDPVDVFEVGVRGKAPLAPPADTEKVRRLETAASGSGDGLRSGPTDDVDLVGQSVGSFRVVRRIGAGGMGVVYEAVDESLQRTVALKVLPAHLTGNPRRRARFLREARSAAAVTHPSVATIYQVGEDGDRVFIAMELVEGQSLRERVAAGSLAVDDALVIGLEVAKGVAHAHRAGVIHRDLKPDNVMLSSSGQVKILDFGLAKLVQIDRGAVGADDPITATEVGIEGRVLGTPGYMSPEQSRGASADTRSDVFSFGVLLYELLTGERPFVGETTLDILIATSRDPHRPITELRPEVPASIAGLVDHCLEKRPDRRFDDAGAILAELRRIAGIPTPAVASDVSIDTADTIKALRSASTDMAAAVTTTGAQPKPSSSKRAIAVIAGLVVVAAVVAAVYFGVGDSREAPGPSKETGGTKVASPLSTPGSVIACPPLAAAGVDEPTGWFGAAAAQMACDRAMYMLGGRHERTLIPAQLLDLPVELVDDYPEDPYCEPKARDKAVTEAKKRAAAWLDGKVESKRNSFALELKLMTPDGAEVARGEGSGRALYQAVRGALEQLSESGALPKAERIDETVANWALGGVDDMVLGLALVDWVASIFSPGVREEADRLERHRDELGPFWGLVEVNTAKNLGEPYKPGPPLKMDLSTPHGRFWANQYKSACEPSADSVALADELAALRSEVTDRFARAALISGEADLRYQAAQPDKVRHLALAVLAEEPRWVVWYQLISAADTPESILLACRAGAAWAPSWPDNWNGLALFTEDFAPEQHLAMARRAIDLAPDLPLWSMNYVERLLISGKREQARSIAGRFSTGGREQVAVAEAIFTQVMASEGLFQAAYDRSRKALLGLSHFGRIEMADIHLLGTATSLAATIGRSSELADAFAERFVLTEPTGLAQGHFAPSITAVACAQASPEVATRCLDRLESLIKEGWFTEGVITGTDTIIEGCKHYARGDLEGAAKVWRPLAVKGMGTSWIMAVAFDEVGEHEIASKIDARYLEKGELYHGATLAHVRETKRAVKRKDFDRARELAQQVIDAWGMADVKVPAVDEMRALLAKLPPQKPKKD